jgi:hypothetical protein
MFIYVYVYIQVSQKWRTDGALFITHYQYLILRNREFRSFGNRKNDFKSTTVTFQGNDIRIYLCLHCITVNNNNKNN